MLAHFIHTIRHLFLPHHTNNHRAKLLHPHSLVALSALVFGLNYAVSVFAQVSGGVLGYASDITVEQVLEKTNGRRKEHGLPELSLNNRLSDAARRKGSDMFTFDYWAHTNPQNGTDPWYFFDAVGYQYRFAGENLARDFATTDPMVQAWMDSTTHRDNLLSPRYRETGISVVNGTLGGIETTLVVQLFGTEQQVVVAPQVSATSTQHPPEIAQTLSVSKGEKPETTSSDQSTQQSETLSQQGRRGETVTEISAAAQPRLSPLDISKSISLGVMILVGTVLIVDSIVIWRRRTSRLTGRNWAHLVFLGGLLLVVATLGQGGIG